MKRKLLASIIILQIFCQSVTAVTSTGASVDYIPASKNLGIGKINPAAKLDVNGQILIRGGNPGLGKILNSDASGKATWVSPSSLLTANADTLDGLNSSQFLRSDTTNKFSSGTLITDSGTRFDVNGNLSIADTDISLDGANTSFTQSLGNISLVPASAKDLSVTIASAGEFKINTNDLVFNGTNARVGIGTANPSAKLEVNGTIKGSVVNGTNANFTNLNATSIINTGSTNFDKVLVTNNVNGATANFTTGNFTNVVVSGIVNGTTSSFDGDFTNGSVLFSNNQGLISQDNSHLYWDSTNKRIALNHKQPDMAMDVNGAIAIRNINDGNVPGSLSYESETNVLTPYGATVVTLNKPSGTVENDLLIVFITDDESSMPGYSLPSGWTLLDTVETAGQIKSTSYYKVATNSEPSSYSFTSPNYSGTERYGVILRYSNADISNPINAHNYAAGLSFSSSVSSAAVTTTVANTKIIKYMSINQNCASSCIADPSGYSYIAHDDSVSVARGWRLSEKSQAAAGLSDNNSFTTYTSSGRYTQITLAIAENPSPSPGPSFLADPDSVSTFFYLSNGGSASTNPGDLLVKTNVNSVIKTIGIIDFLDGQLTLPSSADMVDGMDSSSFLRSDSSDNYSNGTLTFDSATSLVMAAGSSLDINSTNVSIADTSINLDGADTSFTQSAGNISFVPASAKDLSTTIAAGGEFKINTSDLVFNGSSTQLAIGKASPIAKLDVNGTIHGFAINGTSANFTAAANVAKLISSGSVNGSTANFTSANFTGTTNVAKLISSGVVNGHSANFTDLNASTVNFSALGVGNLTSTTINNSGTVSTAKLISSGVVNGTTANLTKVLASGSVNGTDANFTNLVVSTLVNGNSFDGNFTNGSILFANNQGVISQDNSHLYWDRVNNKLAIGRASADEVLTVNGSLAIQAGSVPLSTANFGKIYIDSSNSRLYFKDDGGNTYSILNGALASLSSPGGANTNFQFNDNGVFGGNGALSFIKASRALEVANDAPLDINSSTVSIADNNISFDSPSGVTFTPSAGQNLNIALATTGDFVVNNNQLYLDTSAARLGIKTNNLNEVLTVNGVLSIKEGSAPSATADFGKIYVKSSDSKLYFKNDSGTEYNLTTPSMIGTSIDELTDATTYNNAGCIYLGSGSGVGGSMFNTAVGIDALHSNVGSSSATAMGYQALYANTNGSNNTAFGYKSLYSNISGDANTAIGAKSLYSNLEAYYNNAIGSSSLYSNISGIENNAFGYQALYSNTNGDANIAIGAQALRSNISGNGNIAVGNSSLYNIRNGDYNTAIGTQSLYTSRDSFYNTAFGYRTLYALKHGNYNSAFGPGAISSLVNGSYNISFGYEAGKRATPNPANLYTSNGIHLGYQAGLNDGGDNNIFIGYEAGNGSITGSSNIVIGYNNNLPPSASASNQLDIADTIYGDLSNHNLGIGTTSIDTKLEVNGSMMITTLVNKSFYTNSSANSVTIDWNNGNKQIITLGHNVTFSFTAPSYGVGLFTLILLQDGSGFRTAAWPASTKWAGGTAPSLSTAPGSVDMITCLYTGTDYLCQMGLKFG